VRLSPRARQPPSYARPRFEHANGRTAALTRAVDRNVFLRGFFLFLFGLSVLPFRGDLVMKGRTHNERTAVDCKLSNSSRRTEIAGGRGRRGWGRRWKKGKEGQKAVPVKDRRMWTKKPLGVGRDEDRGGDETSKERLSKAMEGATRGRMDCMHNRVVKERGNKARVKNRSSSPSKFGAHG
jgi:hypothetical protein